MSAGYGTVGRNDLNFSIPDDYLEDLLSHDFDELAYEMIKATQPILKGSIEKHLASVIRSGTGELLKGVAGFTPRKTRTDAWIGGVYIKGESNNHYYGSTTHKRMYPVSNALKAIWLNYGNAHQAARPWLAPAVNACEAEIMDKMQKKWEEITGANK